MNKVLIFLSKRLRPSISSVLHTKDVVNIVSNKNVSCFQWKSWQWVQRLNIVFSESQQQLNLTATIYFKGSAVPTPITFPASTTSHIKSCRSPSVISGSGVPMATAASLWLPMEAPYVLLFEVSWFRALFHYSCLVDFFYICRVTRIPIGCCYGNAQPPILHSWAKVGLGLSNSWDSFPLGLFDNDAPFHRRQQTNNIKTLLIFITVWWGKAVQRNPTELLLTKGVIDGLP